MRVSPAIPDRAWQQVHSDPLPKAARRRDLFVKDELELAPRELTPAQLPPPRPFHDARIQAKLRRRDRWATIAKRWLDRIGKEPTSMLHLDGAVFPPASGDQTAVVFVNGAGCTLDAAGDTREKVAAALGCDVTLIYNATARRVYPEGGLMLRLLASAADGHKDLEQVIHDFEVAKAHQNGKPPADAMGNPAVDTLRDEIVRRLDAGEPMTLVAHSQGTVITLRALWEAREQRINDIMAGGESRSAAEARVAEEFELLKVINLSGPVRREDFPPELVHYEHAEIAGDPATENLGERCTDPCREQDFSDHVRTFPVDAFSLRGLMHAPGLVLWRHGDRLREFVEAP